MTRLLLALAATFATFIIGAILLGTWRGLKLRLGFGLDDDEKVGLGDWILGCPHCGAQEKLNDPTLGEFKTRNAAFAQAHDACKR